MPNEARFRFAGCDDKPNSPNSPLPQGNPGLPFSFQRFLLLILPTFTEPYFCVYMIKIFTSVLNYRKLTMHFDNAKKVKVTLN